jgi:hypothetical protein
MDPITMPELLNPDPGESTEGEQEAPPEERLRIRDKQLHELREYGRALWQQLDTVRHYLAASLPPDPHTPNAAIRAGASPTGPDDESGWNNWISTYSGTITALAGPHGDSGYGQQEAQREASYRRSAEVVGVHAKHPELDRAPSPAPQQAPASQTSGNQRMKTALNVALVALAIRGLRPRRRR